MPIPPRHKPWAWTALQSLDSAEAKRQELAKAGVALHRIDALYPNAFADLLPGLKRHLSELGGEHLYLRADGKQLNALYDKVYNSLWVDELRRNQRDREEEESSTLLLRDHLLATWAETHSETRPKLAVLHPLWLWMGWWSMRNFEELTEDGQKAGSALMVELDKAWEFPRGAAHA